MFHRFLIWPLIAGLMIYRIFLPYFAPNFVKFDPQVWHKKRGDNIFSSFSHKGFRAKLCPCEVIKRKKFVMATPPKPFDGIPSI